MNNSLIYKCWCKATTREDSEPKYSANWALAKRAHFQIYSNRIECGRWHIPFNDIQKAIVYHTKQWFIPVSVLHLITEHGNYQFGFNPWASPIQHLNLEIEEQRVRIKYSAISIAARVAFLALIAYWIWQRFRK